MEKLKEAVKLFKQRYGKTPKELGLELGLPVIGIYEKQHAFLFAVSEDVINAYKKQQNIIRWLLTWFMWPLAIAMIAWWVTLAKYQDPWHPLFLALYVFYGLWMVLLAVLWFRAKRADKLIKLGKNITFLNY